MNPGAGTKQV